MSGTRLEQLKAFRLEDPKDSFLLFALAKEYEKLGNPEEALHHYLELEKQDPAYVGTYYHLGKLYEQMGEPEQALQAYDRGIQVSKQAGDQHAMGELAAARLALDV